MKKSSNRGSNRGTLILMSLVAGEKHGYALMQDIEQFSAVRLGPGTLYGALSRLEREGLIISTSGEDERRRPYRITPEGRTVLEAEVSQTARIADVGRRRIALGS
jgi:DNA-binding PadR family transcriptional regulator